MSILDAIGYVEALVVGGGGAGGGRHGGGGGGGGVLYCQNSLVYKQTYYVVVGSGGIPSVIGPSGQTVGGNGGFSLFNDMVALGGGGGGSYTDPVPTLGGSGGGGGGGTNTTHGLANQLSNNGGIGYGSNGGNGGSWTGGGGGGGASTVGSAGGSNTGGAGGYGFESSISGFTIRCGGGGGGGGDGGGGIGRDGGGNGAYTTGFNGANYFGGGGGGARSPSNERGGFGGSGIVIISYPTGSLKATGGSTTNVVGNKTVHIFYSSGTFEIDWALSERKRNIWFEDPYVYKPTASGISVYNTVSEALISYATFSGGANSVWANNNYFYIATSTSGIYRCPITTFSGELFLEEYKSYPNITSNDVSYIHGSGDYLCATTISGIDRYKLSDGTREYIVKDNITKCFQLSNGDYYYVVNPFYNIVDLDDNVFNWNYGRVVELSKPIPEDDYQFLIEIPLTQPDGIYTQSQPNGDDIRVIDDKGISVPYYIDSWEITTPPKIWTKLSRDIEKIYVLYGNEFVSSKSNSETTFKLFDDFNNPTLSSLWLFDNSGYSYNNYTIFNSLIRFYTYSTSYPIALKSTIFFYNCLIEYSFRKIMAPGYNYNDDLDWEAGLDGGTMAYIGSSYVAVNELPHYLSSASSQGVVNGTKFVSTEFKTHSITVSLNYQMSNYDGETLISSGTLTTPNYRPIKFTYNNDYYQPNIEIDWVRARVFDPSPPIYTISRGQNIDDLFNTTELHAVYNNGDTYVYKSKQNNLLNTPYISDLYVTEGTSRYGNANVIFLATSWGAMVIEEKRGDENNSAKRLYLLSS